MKHAADVASFYGFRSMQEVERTVVEGPRSRGAYSFAINVAVCAASTQKHLDPVLAFYASPSPTYVPPTIQQPREVGEFSLSVIGSPTSLGEVLILKTLYTTMSEWNHGPMRIRLNALGDKESKVRFERELVVFLRRHSAELCEECRKKISENPTAAYNCLNENCHEILRDGPRAMNFLTEKSRSHFREVLEHVEGLNLPYELDDFLIGDDREPRIAFALDLDGDDATLLGALGGRYDEYVRKFVNKKEASAVSASIFFRKKGAERASFTAVASNRVPKIFLIQLGTRAKLQGLAVVDMLRTARLPVSQSFDAQNLGSQLASAQQLGVAHVFIMGQREALDGTIIVRSSINGTQTVVQLGHLPRFLKTIR